MTSGSGLAAGRVERVLALARRFASGSDTLGKELRAGLVATSGLSIEGVELALSAHLEVDVSPEDMSALLVACGPALRCHVVLAANVCTAALRAIAVAVACAPTVCVRPSRRDPVLAALLARELDDDAAFGDYGGAIAVTESVAPSPGDELHLYGSDEALETLRAAAPDGVIVRAHGTGLGVAVIGAAADLQEAAAALAADVVPFDQRGCLSPRIAFVEGAGARAEAFANALDGALDRAGAQVPRGPLDADTEAAITMYRATVEAIGRTWNGRHHAVGLDLAPRALVLPPAARIVHVVKASAVDAPAILARWATYITAIGAAGDSDLGRAITTLAPRARGSPLGVMQRPPLDGPVDLRAR